MKHNYSTCRLCRKTEGVNTRDRYFIWINKQTGKFEWVKNGWSAWSPLDSKKIQILTYGLGISEVDFRSIRYKWDMDVFEIRLWNHRKFLVSGQMLHWWARKVKYISNE